MNKTEFMYAFCISRMRVFEVQYYTLSTNSHPYFATSAAEFNCFKTNWDRYGQAQEALLTGKARTFWKKWDALHCQDLTEEQHAELIRDIEELKKAYPHYIEKQLDTEKRPYSPSINFYDIKEMSMTVSRR